MASSGDRRPSSSSSSFSCSPSSALSRLVSEIRQQLQSAPPPFPIHVLQVLSRSVKQQWPPASSGNAVVGSIVPPLLASLSSALHSSASSSSSSPSSSSSSSPAQHLFDLAMSAEQVSRRLDGVPVYTVSNQDNEFILVSDSSGLKSLALFCFRHQDAESLQAQIKEREPKLGRIKVVGVPLDKVYQLKTEGVAFRLLPDPLQVKHALEARAQAGEAAKSFDGVPVFQSDNLILRTKNRRFCPIFFSKEDIEKALSAAMKQQQKVNPSLRLKADIQVGSFEDVLQRMEKADDRAAWNEVVFVPPGMDPFELVERGSKMPAAAALG